MPALPHDPHSYAKPDEARVLNVSPDTVKWHLKNIYAKLGMTSRDAAVARLRDGRRR